MLCRSAHPGYILEQLFWGNRLACRTNPHSVQHLPVPEQCCSGLANELMVLFLTPFPILNHFSTHDDAALLISQPYVIAMVGALTEFALEALFVPSWKMQVGTSLMADTHLCGTFTLLTTDRRVDQSWRRMASDSWTGEFIANHRDAGSSM